jgi:hypothetical protein
MSEVIDVSFVSSITGLGGIPVIAALVQTLKAFVKDSRWYPIISVAMGVAWNVGAYAGLAATYSNVGWTQASFQGIAVGLAAAGVYEITRS